MVILIIEDQIKYVEDAPKACTSLMVTYELALNILFYILVEERENLSLDKELVSSTHTPRHARLQL